MVDPDRLRRLLGVLERYVVGLRAGTDDPLRRRYLVQTAAQACIDLTAHVIASEGYRTPADYADGFTVLGEQRLLPPELVGRLRDLAGMRNLIVHLYAEVDDDRVAVEISAGLDDIEHFARIIAGLAGS